MTEAEELVLRLRTHGAPASERIVGALIEGNRHRDMTIAAQRKVLEQAKAALEINRVMGADADGNYTVEITPKVITAAITAIQEQLK